MSTNDNHNNNKVVSLTDRVIQKKQAGKEDATQYAELLSDALDAGLEAFNDTIDESRGFITISFNSEDGAPSVVHAGEIDLIHTLGTLEFIKGELIKNAEQVFDHDLELLEDGIFED